MAEGSPSIRPEFTHASSRQLYDAITRNPWEGGFIDLLMNRGRKEEEDLQRRVSQYIQRYRKQRERELLPSGFLDQVTLDGYRDMAVRMRNAQSLEEKYRLLVEEPPLDPRYADWYRPHQRLLWYDFIQGHVYDVHPPKPDGDPFGKYPNSVYDSLRSVLTRKGRSWQRGLDLGSGTGEASRILAKACPRVIAIDRFQFLNNVAKERDQEKGIQNIDYVEADVIQGIPLADNSVDVVTSNGLTAFIPKDKLGFFVNEVARVLHTGGSYIEAGIVGGGNTADAIEEEYSKNAKALFAYMIGELVPSPGKEVSGAYPHSKEDIERAFAKAGFGGRTFFSSYDSYVTGIEVDEEIKP